MEKKSAFEFFTKSRKTAHKQRSNEEVFLKNLSPAEKELMQKALEKEWHTISVEKVGVVKVLTLEESAAVRKRCPHLIVPSRVVYTWKMEETKELMSNLC